MAGVLAGHAFVLLGDFRKCLVAVSRLRHMPLDCSGVLWACGQPISNDSPTEERGGTHQIVSGSALLPNVSPSELHLNINGLHICQQGNYCFICRHDSHATCRFSIHSTGDKSVMKKAVERYPELVKGAPGVYYCGYNSERSYGGSAWLVAREGGNVMIDSPRFDPKLVKRIKVRGPILLPIHRIKCVVQRSQRPQT